MHEMSELSGTQECGDNSKSHYGLCSFGGIYTWYTRTQWSARICYNKSQHPPDNKAALAICSPSISLAGVYLCKLSVSV